MQKKMLTKHFYIILQLIFGTILFCQHVPIALDHPIYVFIHQEIAKGKLDIKYISSTPLYSDPTGLTRSWHRREQRRLAKSAEFINPLQSVAMTLNPSREACHPDKGSDSLDMRREADR